MHAKEGEAWHAAHIAVEHAVGRVAEGDVDELQHGRRQLADVGEVQAHHALLGDRLGEPAAHHLLQRLLLALRLARQLGRAVPEARDVLLHVRDLVLLPLVLLHLRVLQLRARAQVRVVVA